MNLKSVYFIIFGLLLSVLGFCQSVTIIDSSFNFKEFPITKFRFHTRSFEEIKLNEIKLSGDSIMLNDVGLTASAEVLPPQNKVIFILIENHYLRKGNVERPFFKAVLLRGIKGQINNGDKVYVGTFDWFRNGTYITLLNEIPLDNENEVAGLINSISPPSKLFNIQPGADIYAALDETLKKLSKLDNQMPKNILLLSDDYPNIASQKTVDEVRNQSLDFNIPIYAIGYNVGAERYSLVTKNEICKNTYGKYFADPTNNVENCAIRTSEFLEEMNSNSHGKNYIISYTSNVKRLGQNVTIQLSTNNNISTRANIKYPFFLWDWIKANFILSIGLLIVLIGFFVGAHWLFRKSQKKKKKIQSQIEENESKAINAEEEIKNLKHKQTESEQNIVLQKQQFEDNILIQNLESLMKAKGVYPRVNLEYNDQRGTFYVDKPRFSVGRDASSNSFSINVSSISRNHCVIKFNEQGKFTITDLDSTNGIAVNGQKIQTAVLANADIIKLGDVTLKFNL